MTLAEFLLTRISEDEEIARGLATDYPSCAEESYWLRNGDDVTIDLGVGRALAECQAKRRIIEECSPRRLQDLDESANVLADAVLALLALVYADHSDYREEWRP